MTSAQGTTWQGVKVENSLVDANVVELHLTPVTPAEGDGGGTRVDLEDLPSEGRHHALESAVRVLVAVLLGVVVLRLGEEGVVGADTDHLGAGDVGSTVHGEGVLLLVDGTPVLVVGLERGLNLPVLDKVGDDVLERSGSPSLLLGW